MYDSTLRRHLLRGSAVILIANLLGFGDVVGGRMEQVIGNQGQARSDLEALRSVWDSNGDGKLTAAYTEFAKFKVLVTNANGTTTVQTMTQLGITEINLTADNTLIPLPDGSQITGQTTFTRGNGLAGFGSGVRANRRRGADSGGLAS